MVILHVFKGYKLCYVEEKKSVISRDVTFNENECYKDLVKQHDDLQIKNTEFLDIELGYLKLNDTSSGGDSQVGSQRSEHDTYEVSELEQTCIKVKFEEEYEEKLEAGGIGWEDYLLARDRVRRVITPPEILSDENHAC